MLLQMRVTEWFKSVWIKCWITESSDLSVDLGFDWKIVSQSWFGLVYYRELQPKCAPESLFVSFIIKPLNTTFLCFVVNVFAYIFACIWSIIYIYICTALCIFTAEITVGYNVAILCLNCKIVKQPFEYNVWYANWKWTKWKVVA